MNEATVVEKCLHNGKRHLFTVNWEIEKFGFGQLTFYTDTSGKLLIDSEHMSKERVMQIVEKLIEDAELI